MPYNKPQNYITDSSEFTDVLDAVNYLIQEEDTDKATLDFVARNVNYNNTIKYSETVVVNKSIFLLPENESYVAGRGDVLVFVDGVFRDDFTETAEQGDLSFVRIVFDTPVLTGSEVIFIIPLLNGEGILQNAELETKAARDIAVAAKDAVLPGYISFEAKFLGQHAADPVLDNLGNALADGAIYFNGASNRLKIYSISSDTWSFPSLSGALQTSNNLADVDSVSFARNNLGLGDSATVDTGTDSGEILKLEDINGTPGIGGTIDGSAIINVDAQKLDGFDSQDLIDLTSNHNYILNGQFDIWQDGVNFGSNVYTADGWNSISGNSVVTSQRISFAPGAPVVPLSPTYAIRQTLVTASNATTNVALIQHKIRDLDQLAGKEITLSFWALADANREMSIEFVQYFGTGGSNSLREIGVVKLPITGVWTKQEVTLTLPSVFSKTIGNGSYTIINFWQAGGSDFDSRTDSLGNGVNGQILQIANVQLELGSVSTPYKKQHISDVLAQCQRFYENSWYPHLQTEPVGILNATQHVTGIGWQKPMVNVQYKVTKNNFPTVTPVSYATGAHGFAHNLSNSTDYVVSTIAGGTKGVSLITSGEVPIGHLVRFGWIADARL